MGDGYNVTVRTTSKKLVAEPHCHTVLKTSTYCMYCRYTSILSLTHVAINDCMVPSMQTLGLKSSTVALELLEGKETQEPDPYLADKRSLTGVLTGGWVAQYFDSVAEFSAY